MITETSLTFLSRDLHTICSILYTPAVSSIAAVQSTSKYQKSTKKDFTRMCTVHDKGL